MIENTGRVDSFCSTKVRQNEFNDYHDKKGFILIFGIITGRFFEDLFVFYTVVFSHQKSWNYMIHEIVQDYWISETN